MKHFFLKQHYAAAYALSSLGTIKKKDAATKKKNTMQTFLSSTGFTLCTQNECWLEHFLHTAAKLCFPQLLTPIQLWCFSIKKNHISTINCLLPLSDNCYHLYQHVPQASVWQCRVDITLTGKFVFSTKSSFDGSSRADSVRVSCTVRVRRKLKVLWCPTTLYFAENLW